MHVRFECRVQSVDECKVNATSSSFAVDNSKYKATNVGAILALCVPDMVDLLCVAWRQDALRGEVLSEGFPGVSLNRGSSIALWCDSVWFPITSYLCVSVVLINVRVC